MIINSLKQFQGHFCHQVIYITEKQLSVFRPSRNSELQVRNCRSIVNSAIQGISIRLAFLSVFPQPLKDWKLLLEQPYILQFNQDGEFVNYVITDMHACSVPQSCLTLLLPYGLQPARLLCPWDFSGKNIGAGCRFLFQGIFPTQRSNLHLSSYLLRLGTFKNFHH